MKGISRHTAVVAMDALLLVFLGLALFSIFARSSVPVRVGGLVLGWGVLFIAALYAVPIMNVGRTHRLRHLDAFVGALLIYVGILVVLLGADVQVTQTLLHLDGRALGSLGAKLLLSGLAVAIFGGIVSFSGAVWRAARLRLQRGQKGWATGVILFGLMGLMLGCFLEYFVIRGVL